MVVLVPSGQGSMIMHQHWGGRRASHAAHTSRNNSPSGVGLRALGPGGSSGDAGGVTHKVTPLMAVTSCVRKKACTPSRASGAGRGGRGTGSAP